MKRILLLSDTHGYIDPRLLEHAKNADEIWHAGDIGGVSTLEALEEIAPMVAVYGNIDDIPTRQKYPEDQIFEREGARIWIRHIGGHPKRYSPGIARRLVENPVDIFICGHSHILKAGFDHKHKVLHLNPGAAGNHGWHTVRTAMRFEIAQGKVEKLDVIELGPRGR